MYHGVSSQLQKVWTDEEIELRVETADQDQLSLFVYCECVCVHAHVHVCSLSIPTAFRLDSLRCMLLLV